MVRRLPVPVRALILGLWLGLLPGLAYADPCGERTPNDLKNLGNITADPDPDCSTAGRIGAILKPAVATVIGVVTGTGIALGKGPFAPGQGGTAPGQGGATPGLAGGSIVNPWTGKPLVPWEPGKFKPGENGNPGEPGDVWWGGNWVPADDVRERIKDSLAADDRRASDSAKFADESQRKSDDWRQKRVEELQKEAAKEAQQRDAEKTLERIREIARNRGQDDIWERTMEGPAVRPDGTLDPDYVERLKGTLRGRIEDDMKAPLTEAWKSPLTEFVSNTFDDVRHSTGVRIVAGVASGGTSEIIFQSGAAWDAMGRAAADAASKGKDLDFTDALKGGMKQLGRENLPLNTIEALRDPNSSIASVGWAAAMDLFTANRLKGMVTPRAGLTTGAGGSGPSSLGGGGASSVLRGGAASGAPPTPTLTGLSGAAPSLPLSERIWGTILGKLRGPEGYVPGSQPTIPFKSAGTPVQLHDVSCGLTTIQGMARDAGRVVSHQDLTRRAMETGYKVQFPSFTANMRNWDPIGGMRANGIVNVLRDQGANVRQLTNPAISQLGREIDRGAKVAVRLQVPNQNMGHLVRLEGVTPDGKWVRYADPSNGQSFRVRTSDFQNYMDGNQVFVAQWP